MKKTWLLILVIALLNNTAPLYAKSAGSIEADELNYNMNTKQASAVGNVVFTRGLDVLKGSRAEGIVDEQITVTGSPVRGDFVSRKAALTAAKVVWTADRKMKNSDNIAAFGNVRLRQGQKNFLSAPEVKVNTGRKIYEAAGGIEALYNNIYIKALEVFRDSENFRGNKVIKLEDRVKKYTLSAGTITGKISEKDEISSAVAEHDVVFGYTDKEGIKSRLYGDKAVYNRAQGELVVTGNAHGIREDGKTVKADKLTYNEKTGQIEASGSTKITFVTEK